jgi:hypothetical protein
MKQARDWLVGLVSPPPPPPAGFSQLPIELLRLIHDKSLWKDRAASMTFRAVCRRWRDAVPAPLRAMGDVLTWPAEPRCWTCDQKLRHGEGVRCQTVDTITCRTVYANLCGRRCFDRYVFHAVEMWCGGDPSKATLTESFVEPSLFQLNLHRSRGIDRNNVEKIVKRMKLS